MSFWNLHHLTYFDLKKDILPKFLPKAHSSYFEYQHQLEEGVVCCLMNLILLSSKMMHQITNLIKEIIHFLNKSVAFWIEHRTIVERLATSKQHAFLTLTESQSALQIEQRLQSVAAKQTVFVCCLQQPKLFAQSGSNSTTSKYQAREIEIGAVRVSLRPYHSAATFTMS